MCCVALLYDRIADAQESRIQAAKRSKLGSAAPPVFNLLMFRNRLFRLRNVQIWAVLFWIVVVLLIFTNSVFKLQNVQI